METLVFKWYLIHFLNFLILMHFSLEHYILFLEWYQFIPTWKHYFTMSHNKQKLNSWIANTSTVKWRTLSCSIEVFPVFKLHYLEIGTWRRMNYHQKKKEDSIQVEGYWSVTLRRLDRVVAFIQCLLAVQIHQYLKLIVSFTIFVVAGGDHYGWLNHYYKILTRKWTF